MPSFLEVLRQARSSRAAVLHEFELNYDSSLTRTHLFFEGREDEIFYRAYISIRVRNGLFMYRCDGKRQVYEAFRAIRAKHPRAKRVMFVVDKDLSDVIPEIWETDQCIFVTEYYSIENYFVRRDIVERILNNFVQMRGFDLNITLILDRFDEQLKTFYSHLKLIMAWIVVIRRNGGRPNLNNIQLKNLLSVDGVSVSAIAKTARIAYLQKATGVGPSPGIWRQIRQSAIQLNQLVPKSYVRGKFESWFLVEFLKQVMETLRALAAEAKGTVSMNPAIEQSNMVGILVGTLPIPAALDKFLTDHLT